MKESQPPINPEELGLSPIETDIPQETELFPNTQEFKPIKAGFSALGAVAAGTMLSELTSDIMGDTNYFPDIPDKVKPAIAVATFYLLVSETNKVIKAIDSYYANK